MHWHVAGLRRSDRTIWAIIAAVGAVVLLATLASRFRLVWGSFLGPGAATVALVAAQYFYQRHRTDFRLAGGLGSAAQLIAFAAVGAPLSYLAASLDLPLHDHWMHALDQAMGLDWLGWLGWMNAHGAIHPVFSLTYTSLLPQTAVIVLVLAFSGNLAWLRTYVLAFIITTVITIVVSAIAPAEGAWGYLRLDSAKALNIVPVVHGTYLPVFHGLRDGTFRLLMAAGADGIITFPSLHAALGLLFSAALWPVPRLRWIGLILNVVMVISVPVDGGHYFIDVLAGLAIAGASLVVARYIVQRAHAAAPAVIEPGLIPSV